MPTFRGQKNLHIGDGPAGTGDALHSVRDHIGGGYTITADDKTVKAWDKRLAAEKEPSLADYLASEGFTPEPDPAPDAA